MDTASMGAPADAAQTPLWHQVQGGHHHHHHTKHSEAQPSASRAESSSSQEQQWETIICSVSVTFAAQL